MHIYSTICRILICSTKYVTVSHFLCWICHVVFFFCFVSVLAVLAEVHWEELRGSHSTDISVPHNFVYVLWKRRLKKLWWNCKRSRWGRHVKYPLAEWLGRWLEAGWWHAARAHGSGSSPGPLQATCKWVTRSESERHTLIRTQKASLSDLMCLNTLDKHIVLFLDIQMVHSTIIYILHILKL